MKTRSSQIGSLKGQKKQKKKTEVVCQRLMMSRERSGAARGNKVRLHAT